MNADTRNQDAAVFPHEGLAVACARRFLGRGIPMEELLQEARTALLTAAARFDPSRGTAFSTYAVPVALGALRALCRRAAPMHIPRQELPLLLEALNGRDTPHASAAAGADASSLRREGILAAARRMQCITADPELAALAREEGFEERVLLRDAVRSLGMPYAQVIGLRYLCGLTQRETGQRLGAAQWQISRWEQQGLAMLRNRL